MQLDKALRLEVIELLGYKAGTKYPRSPLVRQTGQLADGVRRWY